MCTYCVHSVSFYFHSVFRPDFYPPSIFPEPCRLHRHAVLRAQTKLRGLQLKREQGREGGAHALVPPPSPHYTQNIGAAPKRAMVQLHNRFLSNFSPLTSSNLSENSSNIFPIYEIILAKISSGSDNFLYLFHSSIILHQLVLLIAGQSLSVANNRECTALVPPLSAGALWRQERGGLQLCARDIVFAVQT